MKQKKKYVAPELTVVQFHAERGYAASVTAWNAAQTINTYVDQMMVDQALLDDQNQLTAANLDMSDNDQYTAPTGSWQYGGGGWF